MAFFNFRKKDIPASNKMKQVDVYEMWEVRWESRDGDFHFNVKPEIETFPSEQDAKDFAQALRNAFKLIKHTSGTDVYVKKVK